MKAARHGLETIVRQALARAPREEAAAWAWPLVCGAQVASKTEALGCENERLQVVVPDLTWQAQLREFVPQYLSSLEKLIGVRLAGIDFHLPGAKRATSNSR